ncbi:hypothetical protein E2C01_063859 [Portunus trituberculatus]|uniref:Uncharacterized protein n=1 Tax=Portunus trituberculatus TaxID=210409 RepID=A0A5B7HIT0_PORTR|nr:hypothetical protein [Portunus trituberculatus]
MDFTKITHFYIFQFLRQIVVLPAFLSLVLKTLEYTKIIHFCYISLPYTKSVFYLHF